MQWSDTGFVVASRRHGESAAIVELLTREHGRHLGLARGGQSPKIRAVLQPGNQVAAVWRGRLSEHLGFLTCELVQAHAARLIADPNALASPAYPISITGSRPIRRDSARRRLKTRSPPSVANSSGRRSANRCRSTASGVRGSTPGIAAETT